jgi:hypothetical protein
MSISASAVKYSAVKCGPLHRKEKVLFVEHSKRLWVALLGTTLFVYTSEKDAKPIHNINVDEYNARPIAVSQSSKNKEFGFEIICPGKKTYQVSASTVRTTKVFKNSLIYLGRFAVLFQFEIRNGRVDSVDKPFDAIASDVCDNDDDTVVERAAIVRRLSRIEVDRLQREEEL